MEFWLFLPQSRLALSRIVGIARQAEAAGYTGLALIDHLVTPLAEGQDLYEAMTLATWVAAHTTTLRLGHLVLCDAFRQPAVLAKQAVTLDHASGGRFELGLGWGSWPRELAGFAITADSARERAARLVQSVATIRRLWAPEPSADGVLAQLPQPLDRIPIVIGGVGPTALRLAREHAEWWNVTASRIDRLAVARDAVAPARVSAQVMIALDRPGEEPGTQLALARGRFPTFGAGLVGGSPTQVSEQLAALDVERVYVWLAPPFREADVDAFAGGVIDRR